MEEQKVFLIFGRNVAPKNACVRHDSFFRALAGQSLGDSTQRGRGAHPRFSQGDVLRSASGTRGRLWKAVKAPEHRTS